MAVLKATIPYQISVDNSFVEQRPNQIRLPINIFRFIYSKHCTLNISDIFISCIWWWVSIAYGKYKTKACTDFLKKIVLFIILFVPNRPTQSVGFWFYRKFVTHECFLTKATSTSTITTTHGSVPLSTTSFLLTTLVHLTCGTMHCIHSVGVIIFTKSPVTYINITAIRQCLRISSISHSWNTATAVTTLCFVLIVIGQHLPKTPCDQLRSYLSLFVSCACILWTATRVHELTCLLFMCGEWQTE